jgi:hypothetical protein
MDKKTLHELTRVNLTNLQSRSWDQDKPIKNKLKKIINHNSQSTQCWMLK